MDHSGNYSSMTSWCQIGFVSVQVPVLFIDGRYVGSEPEIQRMHETGELGDILEAAGASSYHPSPTDDMILRLLQ